MSEHTVPRAFNFHADRRLESEVIVQKDALRHLDTMGIFDHIRKESKHLLVTDKNVEKLYLRRVLECIERSGRSVRTLVVPASEGSKSFKWYSQLVEKALDYGFDKYSVIFSLGGGVVNNLAGFLASTLYRGIGLVHFPTSLLSQVDAAIDFKQAINYDHGKNLIGSYYPASKIVVDPLVLRTLDIRLIRDGLAEAIKHAICQDTKFLEYICSNSEHLVDPDFLSEVVTKSIELKLEVMSGDLDSDYDETLKQYGHAIGHAVEHLSEGEVYHGEAISIGMCVSAEVALLLGLSDEETVALHYDVFRRVGLPTTVPEAFSLSDLWEKIRYDKHFLSGRAYMGLVRTAGVMAPTNNGNFGHYIEQSVIFEAIERNRHQGARDVLRVS
ncbi:2-deoxy-scyllo-inosose synthase [Burkholderia multivorans]|uniref:Iron-containing alcohol dehydrogenase n=1 Tax=Burkholderia multivorans TaxID=87883 RepID=A0AAP2HG49_9BURK|nr:2-deoxy-scyllo-inosose synthase [Burkholderia multivorans]MBU9355016.1 iron-containing alcohol dehydrogenase [Burkholderia multivorans]